MKTISTIILEDASSLNPASGKTSNVHATCGLEDYIWTLAELNLPTGCLPFMLPLLPVRDATSDKGATTGGVGVGGSWLFLTDLAAVITRGGWIDKGSSIATHTTPSMGGGGSVGCFAHFLL